METKEIEETLASFSMRDPDASQTHRREIIMAWVDRLHNYYKRY